MSPRRLALAVVLLVPIHACGPSVEEQAAVAGVSGALGTLTGLVAQRWHELSVAAAAPSGDAFRRSRLQLTVEEAVEWALEMESRMPAAPPPSLAAPVRSIRESLATIRQRAEALRTAVADASTPEVALRERVRQSDREMGRAFCAIRDALTTIRAVAPERFMAMQDGDAFRALGCPGRARPDPG